MPTFRSRPSQSKGEQDRKKQPLNEQKEIVKNTIKIKVRMQHFYLVVFFTVGLVLFFTMLERATK